MRLLSSSQTLDPLRFHKPERYWLPAVVELLESVVPAALVESGVHELSQEPIVFPVAARSSSHQITSTDVVSSVPDLGQPLLITEPGLREAHDWISSGGRLTTSSPPTASMASSVWTSRSASRYESNAA